MKIKLPKAGLACVPCVVCERRARVLTSNIVAREPSPVRWGAMHIYGLDGQGLSPSLKVLSGRCKRKSREGNKGYPRN